MFKTLSIIIYFISFILIFEQIFRLTYFIFKYNNLYDYGKILQTICNNEYIERETSRYHIALNNEDILLSNTEKNKKIYFQLILIFSIIFTSAISIIFSILIYNIYCNIDSKEFNQYKIQHKIYIAIILLLCVITIIYPIFIIYYKLKEIKYRKNYSLFNNEGNISRFIPYICIFIGLIILKILLIYFKYKVPDFQINKDEDIIKDVSELIIFSIYSFIYLSVIYYITNIIILYNYYNNNIELNDNDSEDTNIFINYFKIVFGLEEHNKYINKITAIVKKDNTLYENKNEENLKLPSKLNNIENIPEENKTKIYESIINISDELDENKKDKLKIIINDIIMLYIKEVYNDNLIKESNDNKELILINNLKERLNEENFAKIDYLTSIILQKIIIEIDNLVILINNNKNIEQNVSNETEIVYDKETIFRKNISGLIFIFIKFIIVLLLIYFIIKFKFNNKYLENNIRKNILVPFISLFVILFIINSTIQYNTLVNKHIIKNPTKIYKNHLDDINNSFNYLLNKEYNYYLNSNYIICKNARISIISIILNNIFNINLLNSKNYDNNILLWENYTNISYDTVCSDNSDTDLEEFKFNKCIISDECSATNVFFGRNNEKNNCNLLNYNNIKKIIKNLLLFDNIDFTDGVIFKKIGDKKPNQNFELTNDIMDKKTEEEYINYSVYNWNKINKNIINEDNYYKYYIKSDKFFYKIVDNELFNKLLRTIYLKTHNISIQNISQYILYDIIYKENRYKNFKLRIDNVKKKLKKILYTSLYNSIILKNKYNNNEITNYLSKEEINIYIKNNYENNNNLQKYNKIIDYIIKKYIELLIKNIYFLSILLNGDNEILELGELYNKMGDIPELNDKKDKSYISLNLKNRLTIYINNLIKEITIFFDDINYNFKLKYSSFKNILNTYIINNYNNIKNNKIYTKDIILPYLEKKQNNKNHIIRLEKILKLLKINNNNYNNLRTFICDKEYDLDNNCTINSIKLNIYNFKKKLENNIYNIQIFIDEYNNIINDEEIYEFLNNSDKIIENNQQYNKISDIFANILNNYNRQTDGLKVLYNSYLNKLDEIEKGNLEEIIYMDELDKLKNIIKIDLYPNNIYNINLENYKIIKNSLNNSEEIIIKSATNKNVSIELNKNINEVNKSLLILIITYIISIILINYIR